MNYYTIKKIGSGEYKNRGSKFFSYLHPLDSINEYKHLVSIYRKDFPEACHVCSAYRLFVGSRVDEYGSDDGEPRGTAGLPLLNQLKRNQLINVAVYVVDDSTLQAQSVIAGTIYQWVDCNDNFVPIAGETNATFTTQNSGYYAVEVTLNDCSVISDCFTITSTTGIDFLDTQYGIQLFPNPTINNLTISFEGIDFVDVIVVDIQGRVLLQKLGLFDQERINLSAFVAGTYFVKIITPEGSREICVTKQ